MRIENRDGSKERSEVDVGISFMDAEHATLFAMYRSLPAMAAQSPRTCSTFANGFRELLAYARYHFAHEEEHMLRLAYPGYVDHQRQHALLLKDGDDFLSNVQTYYETYDCLALAMYVRCWLTNHIRSKDSDLALYLAAVHPEIINGRELTVLPAGALVPRPSAVLRY